MSGADRLTFRQAAKSRSAIKTTKIINKLQDHIDGLVELDATQVSAAQTLLRKTLPDLKVSEMEMDDDGGLNKLSWDK